MNDQRADDMVAIAKAVAAALDAGARWSDVMFAVLTGASESAWLRDGGDDVYEEACNVIAQSIGADRGGVTVLLHDPDNREYTSPEFIVADEILTPASVVSSWVASW